MKTPEVDRLVEDAERAISAGRRVWIGGGVGSGRHTTAAAVGERLQRACVIEFLDLEHGDGVAGSVLPFAASLQDQADGRAVIERLAQPEAAGKRLAQAIDRSDSVLVALVPASWGTASPEMPGEDHLLRRARALLRGLGTASRAVWIADERLSPEELGVPVDVRMALPGHRVELPLNLDLWGSYTRAAEQLASAAGGAKASPLVWRLSVGALALGAELRAIANALNEPTAQALGGLCRVLVDRLARNSPLRRSVAKALLRRTPLPRRELVDLTDVPHDHAPLVTDCVGYGDPVRVSESLRARLIDAIASDRNETASGHLAYAEYFEKMDGALAPSNISKPRPMAAWVEKVHHLGRAGATGVARWAKLELPSPDFYWDRARYLSIDLSDFKGAAETYKHCLERFPDDDYAHHYLAYNLQKAKQDNEAVILHYTEAARRDAKNPWWNRRLVVALIRQGMRVEAESAWRDALERVDPDGTASAGSPWLVRNFHLPVAKAWADAGAWREARMVLAPVPERVCIRVRKFAALAAVEEKIEQGLRQERAAFETWLAAKSSQPWAHARTFWEQAKARVAGLVAPAALDTAEHAAQLVWSRPDLLVEVEFDERGQLHWFARDRQSETTDGTETPSPTAEEALWAWLQRMENV